MLAGSEVRGGLRRRWPVRGLIGVTAAALCGCGTVVDDLTTNEASITNGTTTTGDPAVVALVRRGGSAAFCSGTVISARLVLTAGHCIEPDFPDQLEIFVGATVGMPPGAYIGAEHVEIAPGFDRAMLVNDVALVVLAEPSPVAPVSLSTRPFDATFTSEGIRIVGFGSLGGGAPVELTQKREGTSTIAEFDDTTFLFHPGPSQTCVGDSGGPAFATFDSVEALVGITRSGDPACAMFARDTRVDPFVASFIEPFIAATTEGAAQVGELCYYAANCASQLCRRAPDDARIRYCTRACQTAVDCPPGMTCGSSADGMQCELPAPTPTAHGAACTTDGDCHDRACVRATAHEPLTCGTPCTGEANPACPSGTQCRPTADAADRFACFPTPPPAGGGCSAGRGSGGLGLVGVLLTAWLSCAGRARARRGRANRCSRSRAPRPWPRGTARAGTRRAAASRRRRRAATG